MTFKQAKKYYKEDRKNEMISWADEATTGCLVLHDAFLNLGFIVGAIIPLTIGMYYVGIYTGKAIVWLVEKSLDIYDGHVERKSLKEAMKKESEKYDFESGGFRV